MLVCVLYSTSCISIIVAGIYIGLYMSDNKYSGLISYAVHITCMLLLQKYIQDAIL